MFANIIRWIGVSLSLYSRIPVIKFKWKEDDMDHSLIFFPLVGALTGALIIALYHIFIYADIDTFVSAILFVLTPIIITGGFHIDGFMDMEDALRSYKSKEERLKILKDPHIGAFSVIGLCVIILSAVAFTKILTDTYDERYVYLAACSFVMSRSLSGITSLTMKKAKNDGMLVNETHKAPGSILVSQIVWLVSALVMAFFIYPLAAGFLTLSYCICLSFYIHMTMKMFGGVTGDTAGYLVTVSEVSAVAMLAVFCLIAGG